MARLRNRSAVYVISKSPLKVGDFAEVKITKAYDYDLLGGDV